MSVITTPTREAFFDMHGNVWEWTADAYQAHYPTGNPYLIDPINSGSSSSNRVMRGGSWGDGADVYVLQSANNTTQIKVVIIAVSYPQKASEV